MIYLKSTKKSIIKDCDYHGCTGFEMSPTEEIISSILSTKNYYYLKEVKFKECVNPATGVNYRFDFYLPEENLIIEYDGSHHSQENFIKADNIKNKFCKEKGINLVRFDKDDYHGLHNNILFFLQQFSTDSFKNYKTSKHKWASKEERLKKLGIKRKLRPVEKKILLMMENDELYLSQKREGLCRTYKEALDRLVTTGILIQKTQFTYQLNSV